MITICSCKLTPSDIIQIIGIICTLTASIVAIVISLADLKQNSKMVESSSRPYIGIYGLSTYMGFRQYYIIIKNFGQSSATIESLTYDFDISRISKHKDCEPFSHIDGTSIMPGQAYRAAIDFDKIAANNLECIHFSVKYSSGTHVYKDDICLKIDANLGNLEAHAPEKMSDSRIIAETLQDMHVKSL